MKYFDRLAEKAAVDMPDSEKSAFYMFIGEVAKRQPQASTQRLKGGIHLYRVVDVWVHHMIHNFTVIYTIIQKLIEKACQSKA